MIEFLLSPANTPFVLSLALMIAFTLIEIISASLGMGLSEMVDSIMPEIDVDIDVDAGDFSGSNDSLVRLLAWFRVGEVPVVMLFIVFLTGFGLSGLALQYLSLSILGSAFPKIVAVCIAILAAIPTVRLCSGFLGRYMPKDETYAVSENSFLGMVATLTLGTATAGKPAEAKLKDRHGQTHYIMVEPDKPEDSFTKGDKVIIVSQHGATFRVIETTGTAMTD